MSPALTLLAYYGLLVIITILVQVLVAMQQVGLPALAGNREGLVLTGMAFRLERATINSLFALTLIAPAVIMLHLTKPGSEMASQALLTFLVARIAFVLLYAFGITWFRSLAFLVGLVCTGWLYIMALGL